MVVSLFVLPPSCGDPEYFHLAGEFKVKLCNSLMIEDWAIHYCVYAFKNHGLCKELAYIFCTGNLTTCNNPTSHEAVNR